LGQLGVRTVTNHKPVAGDFTFHTGFDWTGQADNYFDEQDILLHTPLHDADGDPVHIAFVNGQRIAPTPGQGPWPDPTDPSLTHIKGEYGTLTVAGDGTFQYVWDQNNPAVQAMNANGGELTDHFTFKVTDGLGGTDFGYFNIVSAAPQHGTSTITFEDATPSDFPDVYKGLRWGDTDNGTPLHLNTTGNHFVYTSEASDGGFNLIGSASYYQYLTYDGVDLKTSSATEGATITFDGIDSDYNAHELTVSIGPGNGNFDMSGATHVDLSSLGPVNQIYISYDFPDEPQNSHDNPMMLLDNLTITV
jgi:hypothetical protein